MKNIRKILALLLAALMALSLCACGSSYKSDASFQAAPAEAPAPAMSYASNGAYDYDYADMEAAMDEGYSGLAPTAAAARGEETASEAPEASPEKIIYSSDVTVETTAFDESLSKLDALIKQVGGWVESSSVNGANYYNKSRGYQSTRSASYTLRIPSDHFDSLMNSLSELGNVPYTHTYTENVTAQYYDVEAHLTAYKTQEARLLEMMEKAETVEDIVTLEDRLTELRYRIESLQSTLNNWDRRVSYSTVYLEIQEVREYTPETETHISYGRELWLALLDGIRGLGDFFGDLLIFLVGALPALLILGLIVFVIVKLVKKVRARRKAKKEALAKRFADPAPAPEEEKE